jgi:hypothetical protein
MYGEYSIENNQLTIYEDDDLLYRTITIVSKEEILGPRAIYEEPDYENLCPNSNKDFRFVFDSKICDDINVIKAELKKYNIKINDEIITWIEKYTLLPKLMGKTTREIIQKEALKSLETIPYNIDEDYFNDLEEKRKNWDIRR